MRKETYSAPDGITEKLTLRLFPVYSPGFTFWPEQSDRARQWFKVGAQPAAGRQGLMPKGFPHSVSKDGFRYRRGIKKSRKIWDPIREGCRRIREKMGSSFREIKKRRIRIGSPNPSPMNNFGTVWSYFIRVSSLRKPKPPPCPFPILI